MNNINVVIIDSGVNLTHSAFRDDEIYAKDLFDCNGTGTDELIFGEVKMKGICNDKKHKSFI